MVVQIEQAAWAHPGPGEPGARQHPWSWCAWNMRSGGGGTLSRVHSVRENLGDKDTETATQNPTLTGSTCW